ncbi:hypothetical protein [Streptomyces scabiei]|uniref:hypothetical protein n=1 Tax=Streptomyces scabiei TaxID=1930 RepID=UPI000689DDEA|nr:hypothetical protein [Streptomyces scabiei]
MKDWHPGLSALVERADRSTRSPRRHSPTISALNSGVSERRGRRGFFFPMLSMMDILSGLNP